MSIIDEHIDKIRQLCATHKVKKLYAFGSVLSTRFNDQSDVDMIVDFAQMPVNDYADNYFDLKFSLEDVLKRPVDLIEETAIKNPFFKENINNSRQVVYAN